MMAYAWAAGAGVMLTAAFVGLLPTGFAQTDLIGIFTGCAGVVAGAWFISLMDRFVPHMNFENGTFDNSEAHGKTNRVLLLVIAIALHSIPEGLATGLSFSGGMSQNALPVALSMVIQKIPEGLIVMMPLLKLGMKRGRAFGDDAAGADFGHAAGHAAGDAGLVFLCVYLWRHCVCEWRRGDSGIARTRLSAAHHLYFDRRDFKRYAMGFNAVKEKFTRFSGKNGHRENGENRRLAGGANFCKRKVKKTENDTLHGRYFLLNSYKLTKAKKGICQLASTL